MAAEEKEKTAVARILVALDASPHSEAALKEAVRLAAGLQAELLGLFVEDVDLMRAASLPFARELASRTAQERRLDQLSMERALRGQAERVRRALETTAQGAEVRWSFKVTRGRVSQELLAASAEVDMVVLGRAGRRMSKGGKPGRTAREVLARSLGTVVVMQNGTTLGRPVMTVFDGSPAAERALEMAARLAEADHKNLTVLIPAEGEEGVTTLREQAAGVLSKHEMTARYVDVPGHPGVEALAAAVERNGCRTLVASPSEPLLAGEALERLLERLGCLVVLVR